MKSTDLLRSLMENAQDMMMKTDNKGRIIWISAFGAEILGYKSADEIIGRDVATAIYFHPEKREVVLRKLNEDGKITDYEMEARRSDGSSILMSINAQYWRDANGDIGGIEGSYRDISESARKKDALQRRDAVLEAVSFSAGEFLRSGQWEEAAQAVIAELGRATEVSRVYIFENHTHENGTPLISQRFEWTSPGTSPQIDVPELQNLPLEGAGFARWIEEMNKGKVIHGHVNDFPASEQEILAQQDILSIVVVPIMIKDKFWGFIGFDECTKEREWAVLEIDTLKTAADILSAAIYRELVEKQIKKTSTQWQTTFDSISQMVTIVAPDFSIVRANRVMSDTVKMTFKELVGKNCCEVFHGIGVSCPECPVEITFKTGEPASMEMFSEKLKAYYSLTASPIYDDKWAVAGAVLIVENITERRQAEEAVLNIAKGVSATTGEKFFYSLSEHFARMLGADYAYVAESVEGKPNHVRTLAFIAGGNVLDNMEVELTGTPCEKVLEGNICSFPAGIQDKFPSAHIMAQLNIEGYIGTKLSASSGETLGLMAVMYCKPVKNVSMIESMIRIFASRAAAEIERRRYENELKRANSEIEIWNKELESRVRIKSEELEKYHAQLIQSEKLSAMGVLAAGLAHELNSPLAGLIPLLAKYRDRSRKDSEAYDEMTLMLRAGQHMSKIVRDFGSFSRQTMEGFAEIDLNKVIVDTLSFTAGQLRKHGVEVVMDCADDLKTVRGDTTALKQVVLNIITNARDAMTEGGKIIVKTGFSDDNERVYMEFADSGTGIEQENIDKIYDPFFTTKKSGEGIGLGLSVTRGIVKEHKGEIAFESEHGKGTRFKVFLPVAKKSDGPVSTQ